MFFWGLKAQISGSEESPKSLTNFGILGLVEIL